jgi:hypothetical protein
MDRPQLGFHNDSLWRAVVRRGAVDYMQIANLFRDWLDVIVGPKVTVTSVLAENAAIYDDFLMVMDPANLPYRGTVVIDEGLVTSVTFDYTFIDPITGKMELDGTLADAFTANLRNAKGTILGDALFGATSLTLRPSEIAAFPTSGFPMSLLLDAGTSQEEVVQLTSHATSDSPLTVSAVVKDHYGPKASPTTSRLQRVEAGGTVIVLTSSASFPGDGLIRLVNEGYGSTEIIEYYDNDKELGILYLRDKLVNTYTIGGVTPVTLLIPGSSVQLAQLQVKGTDWDIFQSEPRKIQIYLPRSLKINRLIDASFLHGSNTSAPSATLSDGASIGSFLLKLDDISDFPMAGAIVIDAGSPTEEYHGYSRIDRYATKMNGQPVKAYGSLTVVAPALISDTETFTLNDGVNPAVVFEFDKTGAWTPGNVRVNIAGLTLASEVRDACIASINGLGFGVLEITSGVVSSTKLSLQNYQYGTVGNTAQSETVADPGFVLTNMTGGNSGIPIGTLLLKVEDARPILAAQNITKNLILGRGTGSSEIVTWSSVDPKTNSITLASATVNSHNALDLCEVQDPRWLHLNTSLINNHIISDTVQLDYENYVGTSLEIGDPTKPPTDLIRFRGHHVFNPGNSSRRNEGAATTLSENLAGPTLLLADQKAGHTSIEVNDGIMFDSTGAFSVTIGRRKGSEETIETSGVTTFYDIFTAPVTLASAASIGDTIVYMNNAVSLPQPAGGSPYGYRLIIDPYGVGGGTEFILVKQVVGSAVHLESALTLNHLISELVHTAGDIISLSESLAYDHEGWIKRNEDLSLTPKYFRDQSSVNLVEELRTEIRLTSLTGLPPASDNVILNFGFGLTFTENRILYALAPGDTTVDLYDTSKFPAGDFMVVIGNGLTRERKHVTTNNYGLNQLTLSIGVNYDHTEKTQVWYAPGDQLDLEYTTRAASPNRLLFEGGIYLPMPYQKNVSVVLKSGDSEPSDYGTDYPFLLPAGWDSQLSYLLDWGRAAGVEVVIITDR